MKTEKQALTVFIDCDTKEPQAITYRNEKTGDWTVYHLTRADEESLVELFNKVEKPIVNGKVTLDYSTSNQSLISPLDGAGQA